MRRMWVSGIVVGALASWTGMSLAAEHGGKEHGGTTTPAATQEHGGSTPAATQEHGGQPIVRQEPTAEAIRQAVENYVAQVKEEDGAFTIDDDKTGETLTLDLVRVHQRVGKTGDYYYSCTDMRDPVTGKLYDLDYDVEQGEDGGLEVVDVRIHKEDGVERYTYGPNDERISLEGEEEGEETEDY